MDKSCSDNQALQGSTAIFFSRLNGNKCNMDDLAFSPTSETNPFIRIRKPSFSKINCNQTNESTRAAFTPDHKEGNDIDNAGASGTYSCSVMRLLPLNLLSQDNLKKLAVEHQEDPFGEFEDMEKVTQSLPTSPLSSPSSTPHGSPRSGRRNLSQMSPSEQQSALWFYPTVRNGCYSSNSEGNIRNSLSKTRYSKINIDFMKFLSADHTSPLIRSSPSKKKKPYVVSNRDLNFLAPTSM